MAAICVMVLGTSSGAGKSWITTALCRYYANQDLKVAPFKAQNMSNNARVVDAGDREGEIGSAQYFQALAAKAVPSVQMNPVLLKPEADTRSQVVVMGRVDSILSKTPWRERSEKLWPAIQIALDRLIDSYDVVVIEGAGSPAEINLMASDIVNLRVARYANAKCLLVTDIDRGGAFAHLYGTWALLEKTDQQRIAGFILNKFRGDAALLAPAPAMLQGMTGIPVVATIPMLRAHGLPEEDGVFDDHLSNSIAGAIRVAVIAYPRISNLDEFQSLINTTNVKLIWAREPQELLDVDWIILPGSKHTSSDLDWLRTQGLDKAISEHAQAGKHVLGICGGLQMLGSALNDPYGIDGSRRGLNLLSLDTVFEQAKTVKQTQTQFASIEGVWSFLSGLSVSGYEIHHGETTPHSSLGDGEGLLEIIPEIAWLNSAGNVMGIYVHGLFENAVVMEAAFHDASGTLDAVFEKLADHFENNAEPGLLNSLIDRH